MFKLNVVKSFFLMTRKPPTSSLFPYTTLFRSSVSNRPSDGEHLLSPSAFGQALRKVRRGRSEEHTSELQSLTNLVCRLLLEKKKTKKNSKRTPRNTSQPTTDDASLT